MGANLSRELGDGSSFHQRGADGIAHEIMHHGLLAKTDLGFRGMNVDVHFFRRQFKKQQYHGIHCRRQDVAVSVREGVLNQAIANQAAIHENIDRVAIELLDLRLGNESVQADFSGISRTVFLIFFRSSPRRRLG